MDTNIWAVTEEQLEFVSNCDMQHMHGRFRKTHRAGLRKPSPRFITRYGPVPWIGAVTRRPTQIIERLLFTGIAMCLWAIPPTAWAGQANNSTGTVETTILARPLQIAANTLDEFRVVDCLLPGQIRRLGRNVTYVSRRRAIKATPSDCGIRGGEYVAYDRANYRTALKVWLPAAKEGDEKAQAFVGEIYEKGLGVKPDYAKARIWYRKAAEQGSTRAQQNLGYLHEKGLGGPKDPAKAVDWYRRAAGLPGKSPVLEVPKAEPSDELEAMRDEIQRSNRELDRRQRKLEEMAKRLKQSGLKANKIKRALDRDRKSNTQQLVTVNRQLKQFGGKLLAIEMLDPLLYKTRGNPVVRTRQGLKRYPLIGRVKFPKSVPDVFVNGAKQHVSPTGVFEIQVGVPRSGTTVSIVAKDNENRRVEFGLRLQPSNDLTETTGAIQTLRRQAGRYFALVIGNNEYRHLPKLETAVADARAVSEILSKRYRFTPTLLLNSSRNEILGAISDIRKKLTPSDNFLIYYAGHGELDRRNDRGHWLPVDAQVDNRASWISNVDISDHLNLFKAKHVLVIADSCYSGALTLSSIPRLKDELSQQSRMRLMKAITTQQSRTALTSGGLTPVLDGDGGKHSVFATVVLDVLRSNERPLPGRRIFEKIFARVILSAGKLGVEQEPRYAPIRYAGHGGGDFVFIPQMGVP